MNWRALLSASISTVVTIGLLSVLVAEWHAYEQHLFARQEAFLAADFKVAHDCVDADATARKGEVYLCNEARRILRTTPWVNALYDWFNRWHACSATRCEVWIFDLARRLQVIVLVAGVLLVAFVALGGARMVREFKRATAPEVYLLPEADARRIRSYSPESRMLLQR